MEPTDRISTASSGTAPPDGPRPGVSAPGAVTGAATARAYAESVARAQRGSGRGVRDEDVVDLLIVVSELVTNAIRHGDGLAGFEVRPTGEGVWIAVHDNNGLAPRAACAFPTRHHGSGYGWPLVARLARDIDVDRHPGGGKTISVLVPLRDADAP
ncbi:hypothetical protein GCM10022384_66380 [Streptomyces marokkonensis]|uniref:Histidine kinase/HSP90-like ATPase domain-containing protein n=1 Tax=Streptomyces marokkonensis TaxID=324855 RepID=A0ABP7SIU8_9ACTN